jgi:hypothetical protein
MTALSPISLKGIELAPSPASIRKDLGYTYFKIGENLLARDQFREAMRLEPSDDQVAPFFPTRPRNRRRPVGSSTASGRQETSGGHHPVERSHCEWGGEF